MRLTIASLLHAAFGVALAASANAQPQWQLVEDLRIGGDASDATMFTDIRGIVEGPTGNIFVLDARPQEIRVFDRSGKFITRAARRGQGPGEIAGGNGMLLIGDTIWVNDPRNGRWSAWSARDGTYLRQFTIPIRSYGYIWEPGVDASGRIIDAISVPSATRGPDGRPISTRKLRRVTTSGAIADTIPIPACTQGNPPTKSSFEGSGSAGRTIMAIPFLPLPVLRLDNKGGYWCSPNDEYVLIHGALGAMDTVHSVRLPHARIPVTRAERDNALSTITELLAPYTTKDADFSLVPNAHPVFDRLDSDDKGQLWARRSVTLGTPARFDVYDSNGGAIAAVTTSIPFLRGRPIHVFGDHVYGVVHDADEVPYVVRARIVRSQ